MDCILFLTNESNAFAAKKKKEKKIYTITLATRPSEATKSLAGRSARDERHATCFRKPLILRK